MAMINCPECGKEISDKAKACIHCGCPINEESNETKDNGQRILTVIEDKKASAKKKLFISTILSLVGSVLIVSAMIMMLFNATDNSVDFDFLDSDAGAFLLVVFFLLPFVFTLLLYLAKKNTKRKIMCVISVIACVVGTCFLLWFNSLNSAALCFAPVFYSPMALFIVSALLNIIGTKEYSSNDEQK